MTKTAASPIAQVHELKTIEPFFSEVRDGLKTFEVRKDDRDFQVGDFLKLRKYDPDKGRYDLDRPLICIVMYKLTGERWGIKKGYCVLGIYLHRK